MRRGIVAIFAVLGLALWGCDLPRDPAATQARIEDRGTIRLGIVAGTSLSGPARTLIMDKARDLHAELRIQRDVSEKLLTRLEEDGLDLVYGHFALNSPWHTRVHFGKVPGRSQQPPSDEAARRFAFRNGENGWIMAMEEAWP